MSAVIERVGQTSVGITVVHSPEELCHIAKPDCPGLIWQRQPMRSFQKWIDGLPAGQLPSTRVILRPDAVRQAVEIACDIAEMPKCDERSLLADDIAALADIFGKVMKAPLMRLRLDRVTTNACRRFHIDALSARLICTYRGAATQFGVAQRGAEPSRVFSAPTGAPIVLRGTQWPEQPNANLLHRSPPIEGTGETRLVLVLDPIFDAEDDL